MGALADLEAFLRAKSVDELIEFGKPLGIFQDPNSKFKIINKPNQPFDPESWKDYEIRRVLGSETTAPTKYRDILKAAGIQSDLEQAAALRQTEVNATVVTAQSAGEAVAEARRANELAEQANRHADEANRISKDAKSESRIAKCVAIGAAILVVLEILNQIFGIVSFFKGGRNGQQ